MYLHVEQNNFAAQNLYSGMGYELVTPEMSFTEKKLAGTDDMVYLSHSLELMWDKKPRVWRNFR